MFKLTKFSNEYVGKAHERPIYLSADISNPIRKYVLQPIDGPTFLERIPDVNSFYRRWYIIFSRAMHNKLATYPNVVADNSFQVSHYIVKHSTLKYNGDIKPFIHTVYSKMKDQI